ncbi:MAG: hypothetical protein ACTSRG_24745, partial [Candidatus Helarchaeota archaeon]
MRLVNKVKYINIITLTLFFFHFSCEVYREPQITSKKSDVVTKKNKRYENPNQNEYDTKKNE